jgi:FkbM family methyltransferase
MKIIKKIKDMVRLSQIEDKKLSFSQCGEDLIVEFIFDAVKMKNISYLDIGAHHPFYLSNTYLFYLKGQKGVCVEPDPLLYEKIRENRPRDISLNIGIGVSNVSEADFYVMTSPSLNTFSIEDAERYQEYGTQRIEKILKIPLVPVNEILTKYFRGPPQFVSLDVEGLDMQILKTFDLSACRPTVFCVETLTYTENNTEEKLNDIIEYMCGNNYMVYADTYINTIFVDKEIWNKRS